MTGFDATHTELLAARNAALLGSRRKAAEAQFDLVHYTAYIMAEAAQAQAERQLELFEDAA